MTTPHQGRRLAGAAAIGLALTGIVAALSVMNPATAPAEDRIRAAISQRAPGPLDQIVFDARAAVDVNADDVDGWAELGIAYVQLARDTGDPTNYSRADEAFARAVELEPEHVNAIIGMGTLALARHEFAAALELGEKAGALNPSSARVYGVIADAHVELGEYPEAVESVQMMVDRRPDLASYSRVAYLRELHGDLDGAVDAMNLALSAGAPTAENTEYVRVQLGNLYFAKGDLEAADEIYRESLLRLPDYVYALAGAARVRAAEGEYDEAIELYLQASRRIPVPEFIIALGETYEASGQPDRAAEQYSLVDAMQQLFEANGVRTDLELASFFADHGDDPQRALELARAAYDVRPTIFAADALAWAEYRNGDIAGARRHADEALRLGTRHSVLLYHAGVIAAADDDESIARSRLEGALDLNPQFSPVLAERARQALAALDE